MSNYWLKKTFAAQMLEEATTFDNSIAEAILIYKSYPRDQFDDLRFRALWAIGKLYCEGEK